MDDKDRTMELYKLEYEKAAERYDNVYRSIWTIFSYLTAVCAGFLAFGPERIEPHALICIAVVPLIFWFWTTYMPLDRYGNEVINRLGTIEGILNKDFHVELGHFIGAAHALSLLRGLWQALKARSVRDLWKQVHRARFAILVMFIALHVVFIWQAIGFWRSGQPLFREKPAASAPVVPTQNLTVTGGCK